MSIVERPPGGLVPAPLPGPPPERPTESRFDIRLPWPLGMAFLVSGLIFALLFAMGTSALGRPIYHGDLQLLVMRLDSTGTGGIQVIDRRVTAVAAIARSEPFLIELQRETGLDVSIDQLGHMVDATRPNLGAIVLVTVDGHDEQQVEQLTEHLPTALSETIDRYRTGLVPLLDESGRDLSPGLDAGEDGPLYLQLFDQPATPGSQISETSPRVAVMTLLGFGVGVLALFIAAGLLHSQARVTSDEDLDELLDAEELGAIPRPRRKGGTRAARMMLGFANEVASLQSADRYVVGVVGAGTPRLLRRTARVLAAASAAVSGEPVIFVDLSDAPRVGLPRRPRPGVLELVRGTATIDGACRNVRRWTLPRWARKFGRGVSVRWIGRGRPSPPPEDVDQFGVDNRVSDSADMATAIGLLAAGHTVVVALPTVPGPTPVGAALGTLDVCLLTLLDGWTPLDDARVVADALEAGVQGAVRFVLIEN